MGTLIAAFLCDLLKDIVSDSILQSVDRRKVKQLMGSLEKRLQSTFLSKYESAPYYDKLDSFITNAESFKLWIMQCYDSSAEQFQSNKTVPANIANAFIESNPDHKCHKNEIEKCLTLLFVTIFSTLNDSTHNETTRIIINHLNQTLSSVDGRLEVIENHTTQILISLKQFQEANQPYSASRHNPENLSAKYSDNEYYKKFNNIIDNYQKKNKYADAINAYLELIEEMTFNSNFNLSDYQDIALEVYDNFTLCYSNIGNFEKAQQSFERGDSLNVSNKTKHFYIKAYAIYSKMDIKHFPESKDLLEQALKANPNYHKAMFLLTIIRAALKDECCDNLISELETYFQKNKLSIESALMLSDYCQSKGIIYMNFDCYEKAFAEFKNSLKHGEQNTIKLNMALTLYRWAMKDNNLRTPLLYPNVNSPKLIESINLIRELFNDEIIVNNTSLFKKVMRHYISACSITRKYKEIMDIANKFNSHDLFEEDYEIKRNVIFSKIVTGNALVSDFDISDEEDKCYFEILGLLYEGKDYDAQYKIESRLQDLPIQHREWYYNQLLDLLISHSDAPAYKQRRDDAIKLGVQIYALPFSDAIYNELIGDIDSAKKAILNLNEDLKHFQYDNILKFYTRNEFHNEAIQFYKDFHKILIKRSFDIEDINLFYGRAIQYLSKHAFDVALEIYDDIPIEIIDELTLCKIKLIVLDEINDKKELCKTFSKLYELDSNIENLISRAIAAVGYCDFALAESSVLEALKSTKLTDEISTNCFMLLSEIYLYMNEFDKSIDYMAQAADLNKQNPYHPAHQALFSRCFRCGDSEGLTQALEFKQLHPNVVDWVKPFEIDTNSKGVEIFPEEIRELLSSEDSPFKKLLTHYNMHSLSLYQISKMCMPLDQLLRRFFSEKNKFYIFFGHTDLISTEIALMNDALVIDALDLLILSLFDMLDCLKLVKNIYIPYSCITELQRAYLNESAPYIQNAFNFVTKQLNVHVMPCRHRGYIKKDSIMYPEYLLDSLDLSKELDIPFLYCDQVVASCPQLQGVKYIGLPSLLKYLTKQSYITEDMACDYRYSLLRFNCSFINFSAADILRQINLLDENSALDNLQPFLSCKSNYDMASFGSVYYRTLKELIKASCDSSIITFSVLILKDADKIYKRAEYYDYWYGRFKFSTDENACLLMLSYVKSITKMFITALGKHDKELQRQILSETNFQHVPQEWIDGLLL